MTFVNVDGAKLSVEVEGEGPTLILIPGANGTGNIFKGVADYLQDRYQVVTYDRRGYGATEMTTPLPAEAANFDNRYRLETDAKDVIALADHFSPDQPVFIMGSSSGSIVAAEAFVTAPDRIARVGIHECPITTIVNTEEQQRLDKDAVDTALSGDMKGGRDKFAEAMHLGGIDKKMMGMADDSPKPTKERVAGMIYWFKYEILQYTNQEIDWDVFKKNADKVRLFVGTDSKGSWPQEVMLALSEKLDLPRTVIPGGHLGYAQKPEGFAETLAAALDMR